MITYGYGAGHILGGRLYRGAGGTAGEIGHVVVDENGPMCRCGLRGCLETYAGANALLDLLRRDGLTVEGMVESAVAGDPGCARVIGNAARSVGQVVAALCNQFNPARVVVGGRLAPAGDSLLDPMRDAVRRYAMPGAAGDVELVASQLGSPAELLGALVLVAGPADRALPGRARGVVGR